MNQNRLVRNALAYIIDPTLEACKHNWHEAVLLHCMTWYPERCQISVDSCLNCLYRGNCNLTECQG